MNDISEYIFNEKNKLYDLREETIRKAERDIMLRFPKELREFYEKYGYGHINYERRVCTNKLLSPTECADIRIRREFYKYDIDLGTYGPYERNRLIFFQVDKGEYLLISLDNKDINSIYSGDIKIADSLEEFLVNLYYDNCFFRDYIIEELENEIDDKKIM